jgi:hypothetical protein
MIRRARIARGLRKIARARGYRITFKLAYRIAAAANAQRVAAPVLFALVEQETGYQFIFGHDIGGLFAGQKVTRKRYRQLQVHLRATHGPGANGVGFVQATYWSFIVNDGGLWRPKHNLRWGAEYQRSLIVSEGGREAGFNAYNGDPSGAYGAARLQITESYEKGMP